ncbi:hypothetical protein Efla_006974 [Eimeria flavescens]
MTSSLVHYVEEMPFDLLGRDKGLKAERLYLDVQVLVESFGGFSFLSPKLSWSWVDLVKEHMEPQDSYRGSAQSSKVQENHVLNITRDYDVEAHSEAKEIEARRDWGFLHARTSTATGLVSGLTREQGIAIALEQQSVGSRSGEAKQQRCAQDPGYGTRRKGEADLTDWSLKTDQQRLLEALGGRRRKEWEQDPYQEQVSERPRTYLEGSAGGVDAANREVRSPRAEGEDKRCPESPIGRQRRFVTPRETKREDDLAAGEIVMEQEERARAVARADRRSSALDQDLAALISWAELTVAGKTTSVAGTGETLDMQDPSSVNMI